MSLGRDKDINTIRLYSDQTKDKKLEYVLYRDLIPLTN